MKIVALMVVEMLRAHGCSRSHEATLTSEILRSGTWIAKVAKAREYAERLSSTFAGLEILEHYRRLLQPIFSCQRLKGGKSYWHLLRGIKRVPFT